MNVMNEQRTVGNDGLWKARKTKSRFSTFPLVVFVLVRPIRKEAWRRIASLPPPGSFLDEKMLFPLAAVAQFGGSCYFESSPMHIPDGFLSTPVWVAAGALSAPTVGYMARRAQAEVEESRAPFLGVMGAFVFAAQMINFPVGVGTTGHLVGSALLAFTLGPAAAVVVMTAILAIQALVFQDGGILAMGANVLNMAILGVLAGYLPFHFLGSGPRRKLAIFLGGTLSVLAASLLALAQLLLSGVPMPSAIVGGSVVLFFVNALLEGSITLAVIQSLEGLNPGWLRKPSGSSRPALGTLAVVTVFLAAVGVLFAAGGPDVLEKLAGNIGIARRARTLLDTPLASYDTQFFANALVRKASAGLVGLALIYGICSLLSKVISRQRRA